LKKNQTFFSSKKPALAFNTLLTTLDILLTRFCKMVGSNWHSMMFLYIIYDMFQRLS